MVRSPTSRSHHLNGNPATGWLPHLRPNWLEGLCRTADHGWRTTARRSPGDIIHRHRGAQIRHAIEIQRVCRCGVRGVNGGPDPRRPGAAAGATPRRPANRPRAAAGRRTSRGARDPARRPSRRSSGRPATPRYRARERGLYSATCSACHGADLRGGGPAAPTCCAPRSSSAISRVS